MACLGYRPFLPGGLPNFDLRLLPDPKELASHARSRIQVHIQAAKLLCHNCLQCYHRCSNSVRAFADDLDAPGGLEEEGRTGIAVASWDIRHYGSTHSSGDELESSSQRSERQSMGCTGDHRRNYLCQSSDPAT